MLKQYDKIHLEVANIKAPNLFNDETIPAFKQVCTIRDPLKSSLVLDQIDLG